MNLTLHFERGMIWGMNTKRSPLAKDPQLLGNCRDVFHVGRWIKNRNRRHLRQKAKFKRRRKMNRRLWDSLLNRESCTRRIFRPTLVEPGAVGVSTIFEGEYDFTKYLFTRAELDKLKDQAIEAGKPIITAMQKSQGRTWDEIMAKGYKEGELVNIQGMAMAFKSKDVGASWTKQRMAEYKRGQLDIMNRVVGMDRETLQRIIEVPFDGQDSGSMGAQHDLQPVAQGGAGETTGGGSTHRTPEEAQVLLGTQEVGSAEGEAGGQDRDGTPGKDGRQA